MDDLVTQEDLIENCHKYMIEAKGKIPEIRAYLEDVCGFKKAYWRNEEYSYIDNRYLIIEDFAVHTANILYEDRTKTINIDHLVFPEGKLDVAINCKPLNLKG